MGRSFVEDRQARAMTPDCPDILCPVRVKVFIGLGIAVVVDYDTGWSLVDRRLRSSMWFHGSHISVHQHVLCTPWKSTFSPVGATVQRAECNGRETKALGAGRRLMSTSPLLLASKAERSPLLAPPMGASGSPSLARSGASS